MLDPDRLTRLRTWLIRASAFFFKELHEVRRQPRLFVSLVGGPFLVLVLFGTTYLSSQPKLRMIMVLPPGIFSDKLEQEMRHLTSLNFEVLDIVPDRDAALARLESGEVEVVQILPPDLREQVGRGEQSRLTFLTKMIDPLREGWVQYLAYAETSEINRLLLQQQTAEAQAEAAGFKVRLTDARGTIAQLETELNPARLRALQQQLWPVKRLVTGLREVLPKVYQVNAALQERMTQLATALGRVENGLDYIDQAISSGSLHENLAAIRTTLEEMVNAEGYLDVFINTPPAQIVSPVQRVYLNLRGQAYSSVIFYAPGVLALLIQHLAVTLGALALIRERLMGTYEVFRASPLSVAQLVLGKYLSYLLFVSLTAVTLLGLLLLLGVPLLGSLLELLALMALLAISSLGYGFLISAISQSDSQAIQLSMLTLLLAMFFSGLFINLDNFAPAAQVVSAFIPMSHGVTGFTDIMLKGQPVSLDTWGALLGLALSTFALVILLLRRQLRRA